MVHIHNEILFIHKKKEILPFVAMWMDLENSMLSEIIQRNTNTAWYHIYMKSKKNTNECTCKIEIESDIENKFVGEGGVN